MANTIKQILRFIIDTFVSYIWAVLYMIPIFNVYMLRQMMKDSKFFVGTLEEQSKLEELVKKHTKRKNK